HRRFVIGRTLLAGESWQVKNLRYSAAQPSRNQNGPRLWSKTQPQRVGIAAMLRLVLRTQPRSENSSRLATILGDTDRLQVCATNTTEAPTRYSRRMMSLCESSAG